MTAKLWNRLLLSAAFVCVSMSASAEEEPNEKREPSELFYLEVEGKKIPVQLDRPIPTALLKGSDLATLRVQPYKVFPYAGISFHYPRDYAFEADLTDPAVSYWGLDGNDCVIMISRYNQVDDPEVALRLFKRAAKARYQDIKVKETEATLTLKNSTLNGIRLEVNVAGIALQQELYPLRVNKGAVVLILQDIPQDNGKASVDRAQAERLLRDTLEIAEK